MPTLCDGVYRGSTLNMLVHLKARYPSETVTVCNLLAVKYTRG